VRPALGQVHGRMSAVPGRRGAQGRQLGHRVGQGQARRPVCRLVPHRLQGGPQLPTTHRYTLNALILFMGFTT